MNTIAKIALAASAAALFSTAVATPVNAADTDTTVKCQGINSCKGTSKCKTASSACAGQNACKGQGWITAASAEECTSKGGTVLK